MTSQSDYSPSVNRDDAPVGDNSEPSVRVRQGAISGRVSLVLAVSLALVIVAFALIYTLHA